MTFSEIALILPGRDQLLIIGILVLVLFGSVKVPEFARGLGIGIKAIRDALEEKGAASSGKRVMPTFKDTEET